VHRPPVEAKALRHVSPCWCEIGAALHLLSWLLAHSRTAYIHAKNALNAHFSICAMVHAIAHNAANLFLDGRIQLKGHRDGSVLTANTLESATSTGTCHCPVHQETRDSSSFPLDSSAAECTLSSCSAPRSMSKSCLRSECRLRCLSATD
jgi:hypothetical protein